MNVPLDLGPCAVYFGIAGSEVNLGYTKGGVKVRFSEEYAALVDDQHGTKPQERVLVGQGAEIDVPMAEYTLENMAFALHQQYQILGGKKIVVGENKIGTKVRDTYANSLLLKKYVAGLPSTAVEDWIRFPKAAPTVTTLELMFNATDQRVISAVFYAFFDDNDILYFLGDESVSYS